MVPEPISLALLHSTETFDRPSPPWRKSRLHQRRSILSQPYRRCHPHQRRRWLNMLGRAQQWNTTWLYIKQSMPTRRQSSGVSLSLCVLSWRVILKFWYNPSTPIRNFRNTLGDMLAMIPQGSLSINLQPLGKQDWLTHRLSVDFSERYWTGEAYYGAPFGDKCTD